MTTGTKPIPVTPETDLIPLLDAASAEPVLLEQNGVVYRLAVADPDEIWAGYDPERTRRILHDMSGVITPEEGERLKELIYRGREEGTRPPDRP